MVIDNKKFKNPLLFNYARAVVAVVDSGSGLTAREQRKAFGLADRLEENKSDSEFDITEEELKILKKIIPTVAWALNDREIIIFEDYIESL